MGRGKRWPCPYCERPIRRGFGGECGEPACRDRLAKLRAERDEPDLLYGESWRQKYPGTGGGRRVIRSTRGLS